MSAVGTAPQAILRHQEDLPFVDLGDGTLLQLLQVDLANGVWIIRTKFRPGSTVQTHKHTGHVLAFTQTGSWYYLEYPDSVNVAGSYLYEPAGSVHTLHVPESNQDDTDVWFAIHGANLNLDGDGKVEVVLDAHAVYALYLELCRDQLGVENPPVVVINEP